MFSYICAQFGSYGKRILPQHNTVKNGIKLYEKEKDGVKVLTSFVDRKLFRKVSIIEPDIFTVGSPIKRRAVLKEDLVTGNKTQINTDTYLNTITHKEEFPNGRLQFSVSKVTIDKNGEQIEAKRDAYCKSPDGKSWIHYISNDNPLIYDWETWGKM